MSYADRDDGATLGEAMRRQAAEILAHEARDALVTAAGAWVEDEAGWVACALCGWPRGTGHPATCGFRVAPAATAALWGLARAVAWATTKEGA
jgi:hypothetical protein